MRYIYISMMLVFGFALSCTKMEDNFKQYLEREKTIFAGKVDSVALKTGYNRIQFDISISVQNLETVRIYWNDFSDSTDVSINKQTGVFSKVLGGLAEKDYIFQMVSIDQHGNKSLPFSINGKIYGDQYLAVRTVRPIKTVELLDEYTVNILWNGVVDDGYYCDISYLDPNGEEKALRVPMSETETKINGIDIRSGFSYTTIYMPQHNSIDEFASADIKVQPKIAFQLEKDTWALVRLPTDVPGDCFGGSISNLWNDRTDDYYHSGCQGDADDLIPHHFTIDLGVEVNLADVQLDPRQGCCQGRNPKQFQIWGISDLTGAETTLSSNNPNWEQEMVEKGWVKLLDHETPTSWNGSDQAYRTEMTDNAKVRYIRYRIINNWNGEPYAALSEITLWYQ